MDAIYCAHKDDLKENLIPLASDLHLAIFMNWYIHLKKKTLLFKFEETGKQGTDAKLVWSLTVSLLIGNVPLVPWGYPNQRALRKGFRNSVNLHLSCL